MALSIQIIVVVVATLFLVTGWVYSAYNKTTRACWYFLTAFILYQASLWIGTLVQ